MRHCDNCGKEVDLPIIKVSAIGFKHSKFKDRDFCRPTCFEEYYEKRRAEK